MEDANELQALADDQELTVTTLSPEEATQLTNYTAQQMSPTGGIILHPQAIDVVERIAEVLGKMRTVALKSTHPEDWVLNKSGDSVTAFPAANACYAIGAIYQIQILNPSPVEIVTRDIGGEEKQVARCTCDAYSRITNGLVRGLVAENVLGAQWTGRDTASVGDIDLLQSTRTALDAKAVKVLANVKAVPLSELCHVWGMDREAVTARARKGHGFGTSQQRKANKAAAGGTGAPGALITDGQRRMLWGKAFGYIDTLGIAGDKETTDQCARNIINAMQRHFKVAKLEELKAAQLTEAVKFISTLTLEEVEIG